MRRSLSHVGFVGLSLVICFALIDSGTVAWASPAAAANLASATRPSREAARDAVIAGPCTGIASAAITHVIVLVEENKSEPIIKKASMPYLGSLATKCGLATNGHNITHPSTGNYLGLVSGQVQGGAWSNDGDPGDYPQSQESLFHQLDSAGQSWGVYAQSMPTNCDRNNSGSYYVRHTAAPYFNDVNGIGGPDNSCATNDVPLGDPVAGAGNNFYSALYERGGAELPAFSLVAPDVCHDLHGKSRTCSGSQLSTNADQFLQIWVDLIVNSPNYVAGNTALIVTWDEGSGPDETSPEACWAETAPGKKGGGKQSCWIATLVVSARTPAAARSATAYNHYDLLAAIETLLGVPILPNNPSISGSPNGSASTLLSDFGLKS